MINAFTVIDAQLILDYVVKLGRCELPGMKGVSDIDEGQIFRNANRTY